jgi:hypothetical protein
MFQVRDTLCLECLDALILSLTAYMYYQDHGYHALTATMATFFFGSLNVIVLASI